MHNGKFSNSSAPFLFSPAVKFFQTEFIVSLSYHKHMKFVFKSCFLLSVFLTGIPSRSQL